MKNTAQAASNLESMLKDMLGEKYLRCEQELSCYESALVKDVAELEKSMAAQRKGVFSNLELESLSKRNSAIADILAEHLAMVLRDRNINAKCDIALGENDQPVFTGPDAEKIREIFTEMPEFAKVFAKLCRNQHLIEQAGQNEIFRKTYETDPVKAVLKFPDLFAGSIDTAVRLNGCELSFAKAGA